MSMASAVQDTGPGAATKVKAGEVLIEVRNLKMYFPVTEGAIFHKVVAQVKAVDGISFDIRKGETLGLVGESGCGKTTTGRCILQLERPTEGEIAFDGQNLVGLGTRELRGLRRKIQVPYVVMNGLEMPDDFPRASPQGDDRTSVVIHIRRAAAPEIGGGVAGGDEQ